MKKKLSIVGGGTAGMFAAAFLDPEKFEVTIYEKKNSLGRKFLVAGDGGFNLTHAEELSLFKSRYTPPHFLDSALSQFSNVHLRKWLSQIGIETFVGSSKRVFPTQGIKPIEVLKAIEIFLKKREVEFKYNQSFTAWDDSNNLIFNSADLVESDFVIFAMGGASWKVTGSDGSWLTQFADKKVETHDFRSSNCAYKVEWPKEFLQKHEGQPLKNIAISLKSKTQKGECVITQFGLEGNAIYGLSPQIQNELSTNNEAIISLDMKPTVHEETLVKKLRDSSSKITKRLKEDLKLGRVLIDLIKTTLTKEEFMDIPSLVQYIKNFPLKIVDAAPIEEAISTSGGISLNAIDENYELKKIPKQFIIGEMLDWDAPTGGYLIQACASMGVSLANYLNNK